MTRVFLHAGFHKTGTKSVQHFLLQNGPEIWPRAATILPDRLREIARIGFWYQDLPEPDMRQQLSAAIRRFFGSLSLAQVPQGKVGRDLIISAENLLGRMPDGRSDRPYPAGAQLLSIMTDTLHSVLPDPVDITFYLSTRSQESWVSSLYGHNAMRMHKNVLTESAEQFAAQLDRAPIADEAQEMAAAVSGARFLIRDIATLSAARFGIAQPFVDFLQLPEDRQARLQPPGHLHRSADPALVNQLVALNRGNLRDDALAQAKRALIEGNDRAGTSSKGVPR